eukprot:1222527-Pleurochrysis_carterae.AAC.1
MDEEGISAPSARAARDARIRVRLTAGFVKAELEGLAQGRAMMVRERENKPDHSALFLARHQLRVGYGETFLTALDTTILFTRTRTVVRLFWEHKARRS